MENETEQKELFNYEEEVKKLSEGGFWKPEAGNYKVVALEEPTTYSVTFDGKDGVKEEKERARFKANVTNLASGVTDEVTYSVNIVPTKDSHFGQLVRFGKSKGTLVGSPFTLIVTGSGIKKKYTIAEAAGLP